MKFPVQFKHALSEYKKQYVGECPVHACKADFKMILIAEARSCHLQWEEIHASSLAMYSNHFSAMNGTKSA
jgi:hypothetical protein